MEWRAQIHLSCLLPCSVCEIAKASALVVSVAGVALASSGPFQTLPNGSMPPECGVILRSAVVGIYDGDAPVCTAVFISDTRALTAEHDANPSIGAILYGRATPSTRFPSGQEWSFRVVAASRGDGLVVLERVSGPVPYRILPLCNAAPISTLENRKVWLATHGISSAARGGDIVGSIALGSYTEETRVSSFGKRHFAYPTSTGPGDSGSAIITLDGKLAGLHLGGWNNADSPPPTPEVPVAGASSSGAAAAPGKGRKRQRGSDDDGAAGGSSSAAKARIKEERIASMGLQHVDTVARESVVNMARRLTTGGYALYLGTSEMAALCASDATDSISGQGTTGSGGK